MAKYIDPFAASLEPQGPLVQFAVKWSLWAFYWHWQGVCWAGIWTLGHEVMLSLRSLPFYPILMSFLRNRPDTAVSRQTAGSTLSPDSLSTPSSSSLTLHGATLTTSTTRAPDQLNVMRTSSRQLAPVSRSSLRTKSPSRTTARCLRRPHSSLLSVSSSCRYA